MSKELDYIADLERENRTIKSLLYCTKRSCNNCGKVNCENFQRQRIDCCGLWVSYKDYIKELEEQCEDLKSDHKHNLKLMKGLNDKIAELEQQIEKMKNYLNCENYGKCGNSMGCPCDKWECIEK